MTRKTRSQAKAKAKASASQHRSDGGNTDPISAKSTCEATSAGIVREVENDIPQTNRTVRFVTSDAEADGCTEHVCATCGQPVDAEHPELFKILSCYMRQR